MSTEDESNVVKFPRAGRSDPPVRREPINRYDVDSDSMVGVVIPGGTCGLYVEPDEVADYYADPDDFVASRFGFSKDEYLQWIALDGAPLCGARTKSGELCRNIIGRIQMNSREWGAVHRVERCHLHGGMKHYANSTRKKRPGE